MADSKKDLLRKTKTYLRSTLLSHKGSIPITQLDRDYRELVGTFIPYSELQFPDLKSFLASLPDVCDVDYDGGEVVVMGVAGRASSHIKDMVARQKKTVCGKKNRYGGGGGRSWNNNYRYSSYRFDMSDGSDWENTTYTKAGVVERAKLGNAVPAGYEDSEEEGENFTAVSVVSTVSVEAVQELKDGEKKTEAVIIDSKTPTLHTGPLPPSPLTMYTTYTDITVSQASSPYHFSVQPLHSRDLYDSLNNQMNEFYNSTVPVEVPCENLVPGCIVAAKNSGMWFRAEINKILRNRNHFLVCLRLVDTGQMILSTCMSDIQPLLSRFAELPVHAVSCRLAGVRPGRGNTWWQVETDWFRLAVLGKEWVGVIKNRVRDEMNQNILVIDMFDTSKDEDYDVGRMMIKLGLASVE